MNKLGTITIKPRLISISGSVHSGKTTISRMIAVRLPNAFYLDGDMISALVGRSHPANATIDDLLPDVHEKIVAYIDASLINGLDIIVDYPFTDRERQHILSVLQNVSFEAKWFLLKPDMEKVSRSSASRPELNAWEIERTKYHYNSPLVETKLAKVIDSTSQTPNTTCKMIMEEL